MDPSDLVDSRDADIHELLGQIADRTPDPERRARILDLMVMLPPIAEWPIEFLEDMRTLHTEVRDRRRDLQRRRLEQMLDYPGDTGD